VEIARTSEPGDSVYVVGSEPQIFFHAARRSATRCIFFYPLTGGYPDALERQRHAIAEVEASRPRYVVWANVPTSLLSSDRTEQHVFEASDAMLRRDYRLEFVVRPDEGLESYDLVYGSDACAGSSRPAPSSGRSRGWRSIAAFSDPIHSPVGLSSSLPRRSHFERREEMRRQYSVIVPLTFALLLAGCVVIEDGEVGVAKSFGSISDEPVLRGVALVFPVVRTVTPWNIKLQEIKETAQVPSSEGLIIGLDTSLLYKVVADQAPQIRKTVGGNYREILVVPYMRNAVRDVVSGYAVKNIYTETGRKEIADKMRTFLRETLAPSGIEVVDLLLRDITLPTRFRESIEAKLTAEQVVQQKEFELEQAKKDAEIEVARARGAAQAQEIVRSTLSGSYLQYLWIKTLNENPNVIYVATEANLPIFRSVGPR
jgi:regulator of protease activity HflC (stomatin/prohibitin superfamily)